MSRLRLLGLGGMALGMALLGASGAFFLATALATAGVEDLGVQAGGLRYIGAPQPEPPAPAQGMYLSIPAIGLEAPIVHSPQMVADGQLTWESPAFSVGHLEGTPLPGEEGNAALAGHILTLTEGSVFRRLPEIADLLEQGQPVAIWVLTPEAKFLYWAQEVRVVEPQETWLLDPTTEPTLTLITCVPAWNPTHRLAVIARRGASG